MITYHLAIVMMMIIKVVSFYSGIYQARALRALGLLLADGAPTVHNVQFVKYDVTVSFMAQVLDTVTYLVPQVLDTAS